MVAWARRFAWAPPRIVDQERVDQREVADGGVGRAGRRQPGVLAGQPFHRAVLAQVDDGVGAEAVLHPPVRREVVVRRRHVRIVVDRHRVLAEPAGRLDHQHHVAGLQGGEHDLAVRVGAAVDEQFARGLAPRLGHRAGQLGRQVRRPLAVARRAHPHRIARHLLGAEPLLVLATRGDQGVDQRVACLGVVVGVEAGKAVAEVVAVLAQRAQQPDRGDGRVQADGVADAGVFRRIRREHDRQAPPCGWDAPQTGVRDGDTGDATAPFGVGDVARQAVGAEFLERERHRDDAAVEFGDGDLRRGIERGNSLVGFGPRVASPGQAQRLQDRNVERGKRCDVPGIVVAAGGDGGRAGTTGGQDRDDQGVEGAEFGEQVRGGPAQGGAEDRHGHGAAGGVDRPREITDEAGVSAGLVGAVVQDAHPRQVGIGRGGRVAAPLGQRGRRIEALAGEQDGVGQEGVQLGEVRGPALREVGVRLGGDADGDGGVAHQLGVGQLLAAEHDDGCAVRQDRVDAVLPGPHRPEDADDHQVGAVEQARQLGADVEARRIAQRVFGVGAQRRQQVGVGRGQQREPRHGRVLRSSIPRSTNSVMFSLQTLVDFPCRGRSPG